MCAEVNPFSKSKYCDTLDFSLTSNFNRYQVGAELVKTGAKLVLSWCRADAKLVLSWNLAGAKLVTSQCLAGAKLVPSWLLKNMTLY